ncbi:uncharacterized protein BJ171DRAFT_599825 [Polychytrium aggregatum]|uniref:uncharacterized protein n=1 Tax=Polychytrium aggregatum TaxID=110093 RepID=UPI0022FE98A8|nr:uncharacterized protein BJ171DRAFT_599825 [Polychytrium aggregatum]KAI9203580.1 hypothetical protein BJ171DRAFT_599825 [Polychytrium aggregatum]
MDALVELAPAPMLSGGLENAHHFPFERLCTISPTDLDRLLLLSPDLTGARQTLLTVSARLQTENCGNVLGPVKGWELTLLMFALVWSPNDIHDVRAHYPLGMSREEHRREIIRILIEHSNAGDIQSTWGSGNTALHLASFLGDTFSMRLLIQRGLSTQATNNLGFTPCDVAQSEDARLLLASLVPSKPKSRLPKTLSKGTARNMDRALFAFDAHESGSGSGSGSCVGTDAPAPAPAAAAAAAVQPSSCHGEIHSTISKRTIGKRSGLEGLFDESSDKNRPSIPKLSSGSNRVGAIAKDPRKSTRGPLSLETFAGLVDGAATDASRLSTKSSLGDLAAGTRSVKRSQIPLKVVHAEGAAAAEPVIAPRKSHGEFETISKRSRRPSAPSAGDAAAGLMSMFQETVSSDPEPSTESNAVQGLVSNNPFVRADQAHGSRGVPRSRSTLSLAAASQNSFRALGTGTLRSSSPLVAHQPASNLREPSQEPEVSKNAGAPPASSSIEDSGERRMKQSKSMMELKKAAESVRVQRGTVSKATKLSSLFEGPIKEDKSQEPQPQSQPQSQHVKPFEMDEPGFNTVSKARTRRQSTVQELARTFEQQHQQQHQPPQPAQPAQPRQHHRALPVSPKRACDSVTAVGSDASSKVAGAEEEFAPPPFERNDSQEAYQPIRVQPAPEAAVQDAGGSFRSKLSRFQPKDTFSKTYGRKMGKTFDYGSIASPTPKSHANAASLFENVSENIVRERQHHETAAEPRMVTKSESCDKVPCQAPTAPLAEATESRNDPVVGRTSDIGQKQDMASLEAQTASDDGRGHALATRDSLDGQSESDDGPKLELVEDNVELSVVECGDETVVAAAVGVADLSLSGPEDIHIKIPEIPVSSLFNDSEGWFSDFLVEPSPPLACASAPAVPTPQMMVKEADLQDHAEKPLPPTPVAPESALVPEETSKDCSTQSQAALIPDEQHSGATLHGSAGVSSPSLSAVSLTEGCVLVRSVSDINGLDTKAIQRVLSQNSSPTKTDSGVDIHKNGHDFKVVDAVVVAKLEPSIARADSSPVLESPVVAETSASGPGKRLKRKKSVRFGAAWKGELEQTKFVAAQAPVVDAASGHVGTLYLKVCKIQELSCRTKANMTVNVSVTHGCNFFDSNSLRLSDQESDRDDEVEISYDYRIPLAPDQDLTIDIELQEQQPPQRLNDVSPPPTIGARGFLSLNTLMDTFKLKSLKSKASSGSLSTLSRPKPKGPISAHATIRPGALRRVASEAMGNVAAHTWDLLEVRHPHSDETMTRSTRTIGRVICSVFFIPHFSGLDLCTLPESFAECEEVLAIRHWSRKVQQSGYMEQQGGDLKFWRKRYFQLQGSKLIALHEENREHRATIDLSQLSRVHCTPLSEEHQWTENEVEFNHTSSRIKNRSQDDSPAEFQLEFKDGETIVLRCENAFVRTRWLRALDNLYNKIEECKVPAWVDMIDEHFASSRG